MKYKITPNNQFLALRFLIVGTVLFSIVLFYFYNQIGYEPTVFLGLSIYYLILLIPTLWVHVEYYLINKNDVFTIDSAESTISLNWQRNIYYSEIETIVFVLSPVMYRNSNLRVFPFDSYNYAVIKIKDGGQIIVTNLMVFKIEEAFKEIKGVKMERKVRFIPSPSLWK